LQAELSQFFDIIIFEWRMLIPGKKRVIQLITNICHSLWIGKGLIILGLGRYITQGDQPGFHQSKHNTGDNDQLDNDPRQTGYKVAGGPGCHLDFFL